MATIIKSGIFDGMVLTLRNDGTSVFLQDYNPGNVNQTWDLPGSDAQFRLRNRGTGQYVSYNGGDANLLVLVRSNPEPEGNNAYFSWGAPEEWGARALRWFVDPGQNVDAGDGSPNPGALRTRGWRHGNQRELTWTIGTV